MNDFDDLMRSAWQAARPPVDSAALVRRVRRHRMLHRLRRGLEIAITYDEAAFEGSGIVWLAAVLDRFFAEYASVNSFTRTVTVSQQRGEIMRWPPRTGSGALL